MYRLNIYNSDREAKPSQGVEPQNVFPDMESPSAAAIVILVSLTWHGKCRIRMVSKNATCGAVTKTKSKHFTMVTFPGLIGICQEPRTLLVGSR